MTARRIWVMGFVLVAGWLAMGLGSCARAEALTITGSARTWQLQQWVDKAAIPMPAETVEVKDTRCVKPDAVACYVPIPNGPIYLSTALVRGQARQALMHEVGHLFDRVSMDDAERAEIAAVMGWSGPWNQYETVGHYSPNEQFANIYADCAMARSLSPYRRWSKGALTIAPNRVKTRACAIIVGAG